MSGVWCHRCKAEHGDSSDAIPWCDPELEDDPWLANVVDRLSNTHKFRNRGLRSGMEGETYAWWERIADAGEDVGRAIRHPKDAKEHFLSAAHDLQHLFDKRPILWRLGGDSDFRLTSCTLCGWSRSR